MRCLPSVVRAKGVLYLADALDHRVILQVVGKRWELQPGEPWGDARPASRLVLIAPYGQLDAAAILASLAGCCRAEPSCGETVECARPRALA